MLGAAPHLRRRALECAAGVSQSGRSSGVEHNLAKVGVEGSNPFARSSFLQDLVSPTLAAMPPRMFTGIITDVGTVRSVERRGDLRLDIATGYDIASIDLGASIACSGVCLTVVDKGDNWFAVDISAETRSRTAPDLWREGAKLNLERSLRLGDELGGHIVTGHVDAVGNVVEVQPEGDSVRVGVAVPGELGVMVAAKGSIALDGVSLTVNDVSETGDGSTRFTVNIIPHTARETTLGTIAAERQLNVEVDVLARYIQRMVTAHSQ